MSGDGWRYIAQRFDGTSGGLGQFLDFNVPLQGVSIEEVLSGHNGLTGTITPEYPHLKGSDGKPILTEGGSAIWAESPDGEIRGGGLLSHSGFNSEGQWSIECVDLTGTASELPYDGADFFINVDPMDLFRFVWTHIQSHRNHNLGISIDPTTSPVRLGGDLVQRVGFDLEPDVSEDLEPQPAPAAPPRYPTNKLWREAGVKAMKATGWKADVVDAALKKWLDKDALVREGKWPKGGLTEKERTIRDSTINKIGWPPDPPNPGNRTVNVVDNQPRAEPPEGGDPVAPEEGAVTWEYDAYKLNWYETLDLAGEVDDLAASTPFDWHLTHRWEGDEIRHHIRLGYPRIGRRRDDLRFVVGENIHKAPDVERVGEQYANEVLVLGAGEGSAMITGRAFRTDDGRVRKVVVISDPSIKTEEAARHRAETELALRFNIENFAEVVVADHPHAALGSIDLGDEILVEGDIGWLEISTWCRVVSRSISPDNGNAQVLTVIRSDRIL